MENTIPELLAPAGNFEKMKYALAYGADAVYAGVPRFSLRTKDNDFTADRLPDAVTYVHERGKKIYLTLNAFPHNRKLESFIPALEQMADIRPDGLILADPGVIMLARDYCPEIPIHLSTQANTVNWGSVKFWRDIGVRRIILSRELSVREIGEIRAKVADIELEVFVHGAICIAYSGRCLLSNYFNHRDANQGTCTNSCRWDYNLYTKPDQGFDEFFIEENDRPGELMPISEDEHGTYIMNSKDLNAIGLIDQLINAGVDSLKIEGRSKSLYYVSVVTRAYRMALSALLRGEAVSEEVIGETLAVANRGYITGFLERNPGSNGENYESGTTGNRHTIFCGTVEETDPDAKRVKINVRNRIECGDSLELIGPDCSREFEILMITAENGEELTVAHGGNGSVWIPCDGEVPPFALIRKRLAAV